MALLEIQDVTRRFGDFTAVDGVSLAIEAGEFFTLLGPSGCGKTTLLRMIAGFDVPDGGRILLNGEDMASRPPESRPVRTVFQSYALFPHMTVEGNVAFPLKMAKTAPADMRGKVAEALDDVRLAGFGKRCWTSRWPRWTPSCARRCRSSSSTCRKRSASRSSMSRMTRRRRSHSRTASR
jgi:spermidine/putrescine transport system ATP-binding protein